MSDLTEASVANITISNESLTKTGESIVVSGKGMGSTVKVNRKFNHMYYLWINNLFSLRLKFQIEII